jgi:hypothetical protein
VYVTGFDGNLSVFDAAGCGASACNPRWTAQLANAVIDSSVAVAGGVAYVGDSGGRLYAFAASGCGTATCKPLWVGQAGAGQMLATPAVGDGKVFVGSFQATPDEFTGNLFAFPAAGCGKATCKPSWTADLGGPAERDAAPLVSGDTVFMGSSEDFGGVNGNHLFASPRPAAASRRAGRCAPTTSDPTAAPPPRRWSATPCSPPPRPPPTPTPPGWWPPSRPTAAARPGDAQLHRQHRRPRRPRPEQPVRARPARELTCQARGRPVVA